MVRLSTLMGDTLAPDPLFPRNKGGWAKCRSRSALLELSSGGRDGKDKVKEIHIIGDAFCPRLACDALV